jgi:hypothetical protein
MNQPLKAGELMQKLHASAGAQFLNRAHERSFSFNVFEMNAVALVEAARRLEDPSQGVPLMVQNNREAGQQAHRELNRHVHNFAASALTLVEHTRGFMRKHYDGTQLLTTYEQEAARVFGNSPVAQFVQGLRNYMVHRGLPKSQMFLTFNAHPDGDGSGTTRTGVRYSTASLLEWDGWKAVARAYLTQAGEDLNIQDVAQEYLTLVNQFKNWLDGQLEAHHRRDLEELLELQSQLSEAQAIEQAPTQLSTVESTSNELGTPFGTKDAAEIERLATELVSKIRELQFAQSPPSFPTDKQVVTITADEVISEPVFFGHSVNGEPALSFARREGTPVGFQGDDLQLLDDLVRTVRRSPRVREMISEKFVHEELLRWCTRRFESSESGSFQEALEVSIREHVAPADVWAPIAHMEIEEAFAFGPVTFEPIGLETLTEWRTHLQEAELAHGEEIGRCFDQLESKYQGAAAVKVSTNAEPTRAGEQALQLARDALGLLRFFSPVAGNASVFTPVALDGLAHLPSERLIMVGPTRFITSDSALTKQMFFWRLSKQERDDMEPHLFQVASSLLHPGDHSDFALSVRASILSYSRATTIVDVLDRLRTCVAAVEGVLLLHEMEPRVFSIANRMAVLVAAGAGIEFVKQTVRRIYWLQEQPTLGSLDSHEREVMAAFTHHAYLALRAVLGNVPKFNSKTAFIGAVDKLSLSRPQH